MKKFLFLILIVFASKSYGQYKSMFGDSSTVWTMLPTNLADYIATNTLVQKNDTVIDGTTYRTIEFNSFQNELVHFYVREDTISGKAWVRSQHSDMVQDQELLIYDLSLQQHDTFHIFNQDMIIDSVFYRQDIKHLAFHGIVNDDYYGCAIEGVGLTIGFQEGKWDNHSNYRLICQFKDSVRHYRNMLTDNYWLNMLPENECIVPAQSTSTEEVSKQNSNITIFPNPSTGSFTLEAKESFKTDASISFTDISGREIKRTAIPTGKNKINFNLNEVQSGIYFLMLQTEEAKYYQKIIIHH